MAINIDSHKAEALLGEISSMTGQGITGIVVDLARQEAERLRRAREQDVEARRRAIDEASARYAARLGPNPPPIDQVLGYDENGLPR